MIPATIRKLLGLTRNTRFSVQVQDGAIILRPVREDDWRSMMGSVGGSSLTSWIEEEHRKERKR